MASGNSFAYKVASRYATAFIDLAEENSATKQVEKDISSLLSLLDESDDFQFFVETLSFSKEQQTKILDDLLAKSSFHKITQNFLNVVVENGRLHNLQALLDFSRLELSKRRGEMEVDVQSASVLSAAQQKQLVKVLGQVTGKDVVLNIDVNEDLIGGLVVTVGSQRIDSSVAGRLDRLKDAMGKRMTTNSNDNLNKETKKEA